MKGIKFCELYFYNDVLWKNNQCYELFYYNVNRFLNLTLCNDFVLFQCAQLQQSIRLFRTNFTADLVLNSTHKQNKDDPNRCSTSTSSDSDSTDRYSDQDDDGKLCDKKDFVFQ